MIRYIIAFAALAIILAFALGPKPIQWWDLITLLSFAFAGWVAAED